MPTQEQAQQAADNLNAILSAATITEIEYKILETFSQGNYTSSWAVTLVPTSHNAKYAAATAEQLAAFARVSQITINEGNTVDATFVAPFDANAELDPVLGPYLP